MTPKELLVWPINKEMGKNLTSFEIVAVKSKDCLWRGKQSTIFSTSFRNPRSRRWSASSSISIFNPIKCTDKPLLFSMWSSSRPGVATSIWKRLAPESYLHVLILKHRNINCIFISLPFSFSMHMRWNDSKCNWQKAQKQTWQGSDSRRLWSSLIRVPPTSVSIPIPSWYFSIAFASAAIWLASSLVGQIIRTYIGETRCLALLLLAFKTSSITGSCLCFTMALKERS